MALAKGDKWHLDEVVVTIKGKPCWLWRAVDQNGVVIDVLVQTTRDKEAAERLLRKLIKKQMGLPRVIITDKLRSYAAGIVNLSLVSRNVDEFFLQPCCYVDSLSNGRHSHDVSPTREPSVH